ncbi:MAG: hypothetical protein UR68_C0020G0034 [Candidatus Roizmanbacteria bacterium GW2011_GWA2_35_19]|uniref:DUF202 domain-containing protein n=2 Tax=Candidatus Roizmaniibacteriota TaxID=1752723 RepID=A0A0G0BRU8_9BACT|nr:MAG: hypothetical protein UR63_C0033G0005 [Candidatus Roizmanbacteria bacterium GW2011_GWC2_35_12]KKP72179.1 MAG: hypothetical protein UR68_C0020G0034 [Candidatus Roizmanbacteria bacterium GW2011_GWA2_35_19]
MKKTEWILRDYLAGERTGLSIDRTLLSYIRTAMTTTIVGISLIKLFDESYLHFIGLLLIIFALGLIVIGFLRTKSQKLKLKEDFK